MAKFFAVMMMLLVHAIRAAARGRADLVLENVALRQQVTALKQQRPRPPLHDGHRAFWVALRSAWSGWASRLVVVHPDTVVRWHRRRFLHFNATFHPTEEWVMQQLREAFPYDTAPRYLIFDRDSIFSRAVVAFVKSMGTRPTRTAYFSPWQNPVAERWVGVCCVEMLDHVVVFGERHLARLVRAYIAYHTHDRTHLSLGKDTPAGRPVTPRPGASARVVALPRVGGLHHRYEWRDAA
jgi:hypothetical protein